jgi:hypothetical protein
MSLYISTEESGFKELSKKDIQVKKLIAVIIIHVKGTLFQNKTFFNSFPFINSFKHDK